MEEVQYLIPVPVTLRGDYLRQVIRNGHVPGVLSGANLKGKAKRYGAGYARQRKRAEAVVSQYGIRSGFALINSHWSRVWIRDGAPVRLDVVNLYERP